MNIPEAKTMNQVSAETFFTALKADKRDIMPTIVSGYPYTSEWRTQDMARAFFGKTIDLVNGDTQYFLAQETKIEEVR